MTRPNRVTEEQIAAAQLRVYLDDQQGRTTPDLVQKIANSVPGDEVGEVSMETSGEAAGARFKDTIVQVKRGHGDPVHVDMNALYDRTLEISGSFLRSTPIKNLLDRDVLTVFRYGDQYSVTPSIFTREEISELDEDGVKRVVRQWMQSNRAAADERED